MLESKFRKSAHTKEGERIKPFLILIVLVVVVLAGVSGYMSWRSVYDESRNSMRHQNRALINRIDGWIHQKVNLVNYNAKLLRDTSFPTEMIYPFFAALVAANDDLSDVFIGLPDGTWISGVMGDYLRTDWASYDQIWYRMAADAPGVATFIPPYWDQTLNQLAFASVRTVLNDSTDKGVVAVDVPFSAMAAYIADANELHGSTTFILDADGYILLHPIPEFAPDENGNFQNAFVLNDGIHAEMTRAVLEDGSFVGGGIVYVGDALETTGWFVVTRVPLAYIMDDVTAVFWSISATVIIALLGVGMGLAALSSVRRAMVKMREAEERSSLLLEAVPIACYFLDSNYSAIDCNLTAVQLFVREPGKPMEYHDAESNQTIKCDWDCTTCGRMRDKNCIARKYLLENYVQIIYGCVSTAADGRKWIHEQCEIALKQGIHQFERDHEALSGETIPCAVTIVPLVYKNDHAYACYLQDLRQTKRIAAETHLREMAEEESRAKTRFLARMSHEIRTPMNAVLGVTELMLRKDTHPKDTHDAFLRIKNSSGMLLAIINDLLDLSKVEAGKLELTNAQYDTRRLISETMQINHMHAQNKDIRFELLVDEDLPAALIGDQLRIKQILNNLLSNALKYTREGSVRLTVRAEKTAPKGQITIAFVVTDTGQGMTRDQVDNLFAEFARFNSRLNTHVEGAGLGMPIVQHLIRLMHGAIKVESTPDVGTVVAVRILQDLCGAPPIGKAAAQQLQTPGISPEDALNDPMPEIIPIPYGRVLVVDDVDVNIDVVEGILDLYEITVDSCQSGQCAVNKIADGAVYDLIFMDHMMPEMDGIEATRAIRAMGYAGPIVVLTANAVKDTQEMFLANGFSGFISKPIDFAELDKYLDKFVRKH